MIVIHCGLPHLKPCAPERRLDCAMLMCCVMSMLLSLAWVPSFGLMAPRLVWLLLLSIVTFAGLLHNESRTAEPIIPLALFTHPVIASCSIGTFVMSIGMFGTIVYLPLFMQGVLAACRRRSPGGYSAPRRCSVRASTRPSESSVRSSSHLERFFSHD